MNWISCAERLPECDEEVLVTRRFLGAKECPPSIYVEIAELVYVDEEGQHWAALSDEYKIYARNHTNPIAWMPLPEPYTEGVDKEGEQK